MKDVKKITIKDLESQLWAAADKLRGNLSAEDYMHVVLGIITLKFINDKYKKVKQKYIDDGYSEEEFESDDDILALETIFRVPNESSWEHITKYIGTSEIGLVLDEAINQLSKVNKDLRGVFTSKYNDETIDKNRLGEVVKIFDNIDDISEQGEDILGRVYEYFLGYFFLQRGQKGGEFYTPSSIVKIIVSILNPLKGRIYDPSCGTAGMLVQAKQHILSKGGSLTDITVYGQEFMDVTWKLAKLNLIINGFNISNSNEAGKDEGVLGEKPADTFTNDQHKTKTFDFIMANPPFNLKTWFHESLLDDPRWEYGLPPKGNANFAWLQHILYKLTPNGKAGVVLANGSLTSGGVESKIREKIINANKVSIIITLPDKLFYTTGIPASIWFFDKGKKTDKILFIDAQSLGQLIDGSKKNKEITQENIDKIVELSNKFENGEEIDIPGLAKTASLDEIKENEYQLLPGKYISIPEDEQKDKNVIKQELKKDIDALLKLIDESKELENELKEAIKKIDLD